MSDYRYRVEILFRKNRVAVITGYSLEADGFCMITREARVKDIAPEFKLVSTDKEHDMCKYQAPGKAKATACTYGGVVTSVRLGSVDVTVPFSRTF
jgi:hypothetical protein